MILMRENPLLGPLEVVGPENQDLALTSIVAISGPNNLALKWIFTHQNHYVPRHINNRYINS